MNDATLAQYALDIYDSPGLHGHTIEVADLRAEISGDGPEITVTFCGSRNFRNWLRNLDARKTSHPWGKVHAGFWGAWETIKPALKPFIDEARSVVFDGHSLGGALANCAASDYAAKTSQLVDLGCPRVGNGSFAAALAKAVPNHTRLVHRFDPVTRLPSGLWGFRHPCRATWYDGSRWTTLGPWQWLVAAWSARAALIDDVLHDHAVENYVAALRGPRAMLARPSRGPDWPHMLIGLKRSDRWPAVRRAHLKKEPVCQVPRTPGPRMH